MAGQAADLQFESPAAAMEDIGQVAEDRLDLIGGAEQGETAAEREDRGRGEEGRARLQPGNDLGIDHLQVATERIVDPAGAVFDHHGRVRLIRLRCTLPSVAPVVAAPECKKRQCDIVRDVSWLVFGMVWKFRHHESLIRLKRPASCRDASSKRVAARNVGDRLMAGAGSSFINDGAVRRFPATRRQGGVQCFFPFSTSSRSVSALRAPTRWGRCRRPTAFLDLILSRDWPRPARRHRRRDQGRACMVRSPLPASAMARTAR